MVWKINFSVHFGSSKKICTINNTISVGRLIRRSDYKQTVAGSFLRLVKLVSSAGVQRRRGASSGSRMEEVSRGATREIVPNITE